MLYNETSPQNLYQHIVIFLMLLLSADICFKINCCLNYFKNTTRMSNSLDPDLSGLL